MQCLHCQHVNRDGEPLCAQCGRALADAAGSTLERRQITSLFCDLVGSTALSHRLDPEDLREVIVGYQRATQRVIEQYEGYVARYMGDGVLAYFGFPAAHEDDAARAVHAALEILDSVRAARPAGVPDGLSVRIGIASGLVVVGDVIGLGAAKEAPAVGESINLAARLQALASPGSVLVGERTRQLIDGRFDFEDHGAHVLNGFERPVPAWRVLRAVAAESRFDANRERGMTPFVGRAAELETGLALWRRARGGEGQVLLLLGDAGIGKSRLAETLAQRVLAADAAVTRLQCSPYHLNSALYPVIQRLEREAGFAPGDSGERKRDKLRALVEREGGDVAAGAGAGGVAPAALLAALLSLPAHGREPPLALTPPQQMARTLSLLADWLPRAAARVPRLILFEDAHWIDPTSLELLELLVERLKPLPVLLVVTARVALPVSWSGQPHVSALILDRLDAPDAAEMARSLLRPGATSAAQALDMVGQVVRRTDGVPLFIEEFVKAIEASAPPADGAATAPVAAAPGVPLTLQDSLMARLDRLGAAKQVAQVAAVLGREFTRQALAQLSGMEAQALDAALAVLTRSQVLYGRADAPGPAYVFKHALMQEAAYASVLRRRRQELHARAALQLAQPEPGVEPEPIAHHFALAGEALSAARYYALAARRSLDRWANPEALAHAQAGLAQLAQVEPGPERDEIELLLAMMEGTAHRAVHGFASVRVEQSFARALALCERLADTKRVSEVRRGLFSFYYARGELDLAQQQGEQVIRLIGAGGQGDDGDTRVMGEWMVGVMAFWSGDFETARRRLETAVSLYRPKARDATALALQIDPGVNAWSHLTWTLWILGQPEAALACGARAVATARSLQQPLALAMAQFFTCATLACCGRREALQAPLQELLDVTGDNHFVYLGACARVLKGQWLIESGQAMQGLALTEQALREFEAQEAQLGVPWVQSIMAQGHAQLGRTQRAMEVIERALAATERKGERQWAPEVWRVKAALLRQLHGAGREAETMAAMHTALSLARAQGARSLELRAATDLAALLLAHGERTTADALLASAMDKITQGEASADWRAASALRARCAAP